MVRWVGWLVGGLVVAARLGGGSEMDGETGGQEEVEVGRKRLYTEQGRKGRKGRTNDRRSPIIRRKWAIHHDTGAIWAGEGCPSLLRKRNRCMCGGSPSVPQLWNALQPLERWNAGTLETLERRV